jgi:hypothetical protein
VLAPEFIAELGSTLQCILPFGKRVVDPSATIATQGIGKAINLDRALPALGGAVD